MASVSTYLNFPGTTEQAFMYYKKVFGTDACESMGFHLVQGNNVFITLHPESREETDRLFAALSKGGQVDMPLQDMFWGDYFGTLTDKLGTKWMFNFGPSYA